MATTRLLVRNLSFDTTRASLVDLFSAVGGMLDLSMPQNRDTGQTRGLAYVAMASDADAQAAIDRLNGHMLDGRPLRISLAPETTAPPFARSLQRDRNWTPACAGARRMRPGLAEAIRAAARRAC